MSRILGTFAPDSPEWYAARAGRVGGSDVAAICGWSPYTTREQLLTQKATNADTKIDTPATRRGHLVEPAILAWLEWRHDLTIDPIASEATYTHDDNDRWLYNPDALTTSGVLLEAKSTTDRCTDRGWGRAGTDQVPLGYQAQVIWGMGILGLQVCHLGVLAGAVNGRPCLDFATYTIPFNPRIFAHIARRVDAFLADLDHLIERTPAA